MEAVHLEIELEKIKVREEMIASEIIQKRKELEAEVRMELMLEKQILSMRNNIPYSSVVEPCVGMNCVMSYSGFRDDVGGANDSLRSNPEDVVRGGEGREVDGGDDGGVSMGKWPFRRDPRLVAARLGGIEVAELGAGEVFDQTMPNSGIFGIKRKAETSEIYRRDEMAASVASKNLQKNWYCSLCDVSATSSGGLNLHLHGKKHKAMEAISKNSNIASSNNADSFDENMMQTMEQSETLVQPLEEEKKHLQLEEERSQMQLKKSVVQPVEEETSQVTKKWECSLCQISVTSEILLNSHLQGRKHQAKEAQSKSGATASNTSADSFCTKNIMQTMGQSETLMQPAEEEKDQVQLVEEDRNQMQLMEENKSQMQPMEEENSQVMKKWECPLCEISVTSEILLKSHLQGKKHKAKEVKLGMFQGTSDNYTGTVNKWYCSVCQVSTPSERNLNDHFQGKKHKAKAGLGNPEAENADSKLTEQNSEDLKTVQVNCLEVKDSLNNEQEPSKGQVKEQETVNRSSIVKFWHCKACNEGTYDEATMDYHRRSSKHMDMLQKIGGGLIVVSSVPNEAVVGGKASQQTTVLQDNDIETEN